MTAGASDPKSPLHMLFASEGAADTHFVGHEMVRAVLTRRYGFDGEFRELTAERDQNFRVMDPAGHPLVFKIFGAAASMDEAHLLAAILAFLETEAPDLPVPRLAPNAAGDAITLFRDETGQERAAVAYSFLPGVPAFDAQRSPRQHRNCGTLLARLAKALEGFSHPCMYRPLVWDLKHLLALREVIPQIETLHFADFVTGFLDRFETAVAPQLDALPRRFVHNDMNAGNIIVDPADPTRITGVIDFGDAVHTYRIADVAVGVIGQLSTPDAASVAIDEFVSAYCEVNPLDEQERHFLPWLIAGRIVQNLILTSWYREQNPDGAHFAAFGRDFFEWRVDLARRLID